MARQQVICNLHFYQGIQWKCILDNFFGISYRMDIRCHWKQNPVHSACVIRRSNVYRPYLHTHYSCHTSAVWKTVPAENVSGLLQACYQKIHFNGLHWIWTSRFLRQVHPCFKRMSMERKHYPLLFRIPRCRHSIGNYSYHNRCKGWPSAARFHCTHGCSFNVLR